MALLNRAQVRSQVPNVGILGCKLVSKNYQDWDLLESQLQVNLVALTAFVIATDFEIKAVFVGQKFPEVGRAKLKMPVFHSLALDVSVDALAFLALVRIGGPTATQKLLGVCVEEARILDWTHGLLGTLFGQEPFFDALVLEVEFVARDPLQTNQEDFRSRGRVFHPLEVSPVLQKGPALFKKLLHTD